MDSQGRMGRYRPKQVDNPIPSFAQPCYWLKTNSFITL